MSENALKSSHLTTGGNRSKKGDHTPVQGLEPFDGIGPHAAIGAFGADLSAPEDRQQRFEDVPVIAMLVDVEDRLELPTSVPVHHR